MSNTQKIWINCEERCMRCYSWCFLQHVRITYLAVMLNLTSTNLLFFIKWVRKYPFNRYMDNVELQNSSDLGANINHIILWFGNESQWPFKNNVFTNSTQFKKFTYDCFNFQTKLSLSRVLGLRVGFWLQNSWNIYLKETQFVKQFGHYEKS